jgi:hypothetical protein
MGKAIEWPIVEKNSKSMPVAKTGGRGGPWRRVIEAGATHLATTGVGNPAL